MIKHALFFLFFFFGSELIAQDITFFSEDLYFTLTSDNFEVNGHYFFRNSSDKKIQQLMFYPFPDADKYGEISSIDIKREGDTISKIATVSEKGSLYKLFIEPFGEVIYHIKYSQKLNSNQAKYILSTTQQWGKAFENANYTLKLPPFIHIDSLSIIPDSIVRSNNSTFYYWQRENYMPEDDFNVWFSNND